MQIGEVSAQSGLSIDTIRFYDKSGMLPDLPRDAKGWRRFTPEALNWLEIIARLRRTGMPLEDIKAFSLSVHGAASESGAAQAERLALLKAHQARLAEQRAELDACEAYLKMKISVYTQGIET